MCLREPSLGHSVGMIGGDAGGGYDTRPWTTMNGWVGYTQPPPENLPTGMSSVYTDNGFFEGGAVWAWTPTDTVVIGSSVQGDIRGSVTLLASGCSVYSRSGVCDEGAELKGCITGFCNSFACKSIPLRNFIAIVFYFN